MFHLKDSSDVIREQVILSKRHDITFKPCSGNNEGEKVTFAAPILHQMQAEHATSIYKSVWEELLRSTDPDLFWRDYHWDESTSFVDTI